MYLDTLRKHLSLSLLHFIRGQSSFYHSRGCSGWRAGCELTGGWKDISGAEVGQWIDRQWCATADVWLKGIRAQNCYMLLSLSILFPSPLPLSLLLPFFLFINHLFLISLLLQHIPSSDLQTSLTEVDELTLGAQEELDEERHTRRETALKITQVSWQHFSVKHLKKIWRKEKKRCFRLIS